MMNIVRKMPTIMPATCQPLRSSGISGLLVVCNVSESLAR